MTAGVRLNWWREAVRRSMSRWRSLSHCSAPRGGLGTLTGKDRTDRLRKRFERAVEVPAGMAFGVEVPPTDLAPTLRSLHAERALGVDQQRRVGYPVCAGHPHVQRRRRVG